MKNNFAHFLLLAFLILFSFSCKDNAETSPTTVNRPKVIRMEVFQGNTGGEEVKTTQSTYTYEGDLLTEIFTENFIFDGSVTSTGQQNFTYENGLLVSLSSVTSDPFEGSSTFEYEGGKLVKTESTLGQDGGVISSSTDTYSYEGDRLKESILANEYSSLQRMYSYDSEGKVSQVNSVRALYDDVSSFTFSYEWGGNNLLSSIITNGAGEYGGNSVFTYDNKPRYVINPSPLPNPDQEVTSSFNNVLSSKFYLGDRLAEDTSYEYIEEGGALKEYIQRNMIDGSYIRTVYYY